MTPATEKQKNYIVRLYNEVHDTDHGYLSQCKQLGYSSSKLKRLSQPEASKVIDDLKARTR